MRIVCARHDPPIEAALNTGVARWTRSVRTNYQRILIAIDQHLDNFEDVS